MLKRLAITAFAGALLTANGCCWYWKPFGCCGAGGGVGGPYYTPAYGGGYGGPGGCSSCTSFRPDYGPEPIPPLPAYSGPPLAAPPAAQPPTNIPPRTPIQPIPTLSTQAAGTARY